jgi:predicted ATPase/DNA-binding CsgD family transcriptional regulator
MGGGGPDDGADEDGRRVVAARRARLFGRESELAELRELVATERLLTLVGPPGAGKTRLATEVGTQVAPAFPGGVRLVELAPVGDPASVVVTAGRSLGVAEVPGRPQRDVLVEALGEARPTLVVLDNCEHVAAAAAALAADLVGSCPAVSVLATSRTALGAPGERSWSVPPLDRAAAAELFADRARAMVGAPAVDAADEVVVERICARLDGLPLAVELTATWCRVLSPGQILDRIGTGGRELSAPGRSPNSSPGPRRTARHDTMAAAVEWSYRLLAPATQRLFRQASVFAGGFGLEALEAVAGPCSPDDDVVAGLTELVDHSLATAERVPGEPMHYRMLEPVRQHAAAALARSGEADEVRRRHFDHFLDMAGRCDPWRQRAGTPAVTVERLARDEDNVLAALAWGRRQPTDLGLRLAVATGPYLVHGGRVNDGLRWTEEALDDGTPDPGLRAAALAQAGQLAWRQRDYDRARARCDEAIALAAEIGDLALQARTLGLLSLIESSAGCTDAAAAHAQRSVDLCEVGGDGLDLAGALVCRAWARYAMGEPDAGDDDLRAALAANERFHNPTITGHGHFGLNFGAALRGDTRAQRHHLAAADVAITDGGVVERSDWLSLAAMLAAREGRYHAALHLFGGMDAWERRRGGSKSPLQHVGPFERLFAEVFERVDETRAVDLWNEGRHMRWDDLVAEALAPKPTPSPLTPREAEVAELVAQGLSNVDIARRLVLSRRTVESHVDHIKQKLSLASRNEIIVWALRGSVPSHGP